MPASEVGIFKTHRYGIGFENVLNYFLPENLLIIKITTATIVMTIKIPTPIAALS